MASFLERVKKPAGSDLPAVLKQSGEKRPLVLPDSDFRGESDLAEMRQSMANLPWGDFLARIQHADRLFLFSLSCPTPATPRKSSHVPRERVYTPPLTIDAFPRESRSISLSPTRSRPPGGGFFGNSAGEEVAKPLLSPLSLPVSK